MMGWSWNGEYVERDLAILQQRASDDDEMINNLILIRSNISSNKKALSL